MQPVAPLVSVVMPAFNAARFLDEAVRSVLEQTLLDIELVVVDDGSTDTTPKLLHSYDDPRMRVMRQENAGIAAALNAGVSLAQGVYIARMDADDVSLPDRLERQADFLTRHPRTVLVGTWYRRIDTTGTTLDVVPGLCGNAELRRDLYTRSPFGHGTVMMRRASVLEVGAYRPNTVPAEDFDLWSRLMRIGEAAILPEVLYEYRLHDSQSSLEHQAVAAERVRSSLWSAPDRPSVTLVRPLRESWSCGSVPSRLRLRLIGMYIERHGVFFQEAVRRRRWREALLVAPVAVAWPLVVLWRRLRRLGERNSR